MILERFLKIDKLAEAKQKNLEEILYPLGLKLRIPSFVMMLREVCGRYHSRIIDNKEDSLLLPDVGKYVAGAVLSIAFGKNEWVVDNNIVRVFKKYFGVKTSKERHKDKHII